MSYLLTESGVPILSKEQLEKIGEAHTSMYARLCGERETRLSTWKFAVHYLGKKVRFEWLSHNGAVLGASVFSDKKPVPIYLPDKDDVEWPNLEVGTILLDKALEVKKDAPYALLSRPRFTLMHECAHFILHGEYYRRKAEGGQEAAVAYSVQHKQEIKESRREFQTDLEWTEWQASYLAGVLLMPRSKVLRVLQDTILLEDYNASVGNRHPESDAFRLMVDRLSWIFQTSSQTAQLRLAQIGFKRRFETRPDPWGPDAFPEPPASRQKRSPRQQKILDILIKERKKNETYRE